MSEYMKNHPFWGKHAPLAALSAVPLIIISSVRMAFALIALGSLVWVYGLSVLVFLSAGKILPERGLPLVVVMLSSFFGALYYVLLSLLTPLLAFESMVFLILVPVSFMASGVYTRLNRHDMGDGIMHALLEALILGLVIVALALIREPLGFGTISLPGPDGLFALFNPGEQDFFSIRIIAVSSGALLLLGYVVALFRFIRGRYYNLGEEK